MKFLPCWIPRHSYLHVVQSSGAPKGGTGDCQAAAPLKTDILKTTDFVYMMISNFYKI
jgi:hypothetical protein